MVASVAPPEQQGPHPSRTEEPHQAGRVEARALCRPYALAHPDLFRLVLVGIPGLRLPQRMAFDPATSKAFDRLVQRVERARQAGRLGGRSAIAVALHWNALCLGLATEELSCMLPPEHAESAWRDALGAFLFGLERTR